MLEMNGDNLVLLVFLGYITMQLWCGGQCINHSRSQWGNNG